MRHNIWPCRLFSSDVSPLLRTVCVLQTLCIHILTESPLVHDHPATVRQYNAITCCSPSPPASDWVVAGAGPRSTLPQLLYCAPLWLPLLMHYYYCLPHLYCCSYCCYCRVLIIDAWNPARPRCCCCFARSSSSSSSPSVKIDCCIFLAEG